MRGAFALRRRLPPAGRGFAPPLGQRGVAPSFAPPLASLSRIPGLPPIQRRAKDAGETDPRKLLSSAPTFGATALNGAGAVGQKPRASLGTFPGSSLLSAPTLGTTPAETVKAIEQETPANTLSPPGSLPGSAPTFGATPRSTKALADDPCAAIPPEPKAAAAKSSAPPTSSLTMKSGPDFFRQGGTGGRDGTAATTYQTSPARADPIVPGVDFCGAKGNEWLPDQPLGCDFRRACINHDGCYDSNSTQEACDKAFLTDMVLASYGIAPKKGVAPKERCLDMAATYYLGIRLFGRKAYLNAQCARRGKK